MAGSPFTALSPFDCKFTGDYFSISSKYCVWEKELLLGCIDSSSVVSIMALVSDLSSRVDTVKVENLKLKSENQVLGQYIENLMAASSVFQSATPKACSEL